MHVQQCQAEVAGVSVVLPQVSGVGVDAFVTFHAPSKYRAEILTCTLLRDLYPNVGAFRSVVRYTYESSRNLQVTL